MDKDTQLFLYSLASVLIAWFTASLGAVLAQRYSLQSAHNEPLLDLGFYFLPSVSVRYVCDMFCYPAAVLPLVALLLFHPKYMMVVSRLLMIASFTIAVRVVCMVVTLLPSPDKTCVIAPSSGSVFLDALQVMFWARFTCADVFFSGHACMLVISSLFVRDYAADILDDKIGKVAVVISWLVTATGCIMILIARHSYTIAVLAGIMIAFQLHEDYHAYLGVKPEDWFERSEEVEQKKLLSK